MTYNEKIVVTGLGAVCPLGADVETIWKRLVEGSSGLSRLPEEIVSDIPSKVGGLVPNITEDAEGGFDVSRYVDTKEQRKIDSFITFALAATDQALTQASWLPKTDQEKTRTATIIGSGIGGFHALKSAVLTVEHRGSRRLSPFTVPSFLANLAAGWVSIRYGFGGPLGAPVTACAAGGQAIGDGARLIRNGEADVVVCGGTESCVDRVALGGFAAAKAMSTSFNETPTQSSRPFDADRDGFVMGEGAGIIVIERERHAKARDATILCELSGYGTSADAFHLTAGHPEGDGAFRAMQAALKDAGMKPQEIDHVNAHATSTPVGDRGELMALKRLFSGSPSPAISGTKGATGHLLGGAGGLEAVFSVLALRDQVVPPTLNLSIQDSAAADLTIIGPFAKGRDVNAVLSNGFGFGGVNASVIFSRQ